MFQIGTLIDQRYRVLDTLGRGGMGTVLRVADSDGSEWALKYCSESDVEVRLRFSREVRIMELIRHPNVVSVVHSNVENDPPYFIMPLAQNSLADEIASFAGNTGAAIGAMSQVCAGIAAIHAAGATHRDLKPLNVLRMRDGTLAVADLGLAKLNDRDSTLLTSTFVALGTRAYAAPEQFVPGGSKNAEARTDVYQAGKMLYELVTGDIPTLMEFSRLPPEIAFVVDRATRHNPNERFSSIQELTAALATLQALNDPNASPHTAFMALIEQATALADEGRYESDLVLKIAHYVGALASEPRDVIARFELIPNQLLTALAEKGGPGVEELVLAYVRAVKAAISGYGFEHAEVVAERMRRVFNATGEPALKAAAVEATLVAAVERNRYAAMEVFDQLLVRVTEPADAIAVAGVLTQNVPHYANVAARVGPEKLHPVLQRVRAVALREEMGT
jgi:tRNA A-37 threonylcarbamoyl transferase component Bud32